MRTSVIVAGIFVCGALAWAVASRLSSDAVGMIVGLLFGLLATVPPLVLIAVTSRRGSQPPPPLAPSPPQPPIIIVFPDRAYAIQPGTYTPGDAMFNAVLEAEGGAWIDGKPMLDGRAIKRLTVRE